MCSSGVSVNVVQHISQLNVLVKQLKFYFCVPEAIAWIDLNVQSKLF